MKQRFWIIGLVIVSVLQFAGCSTYAKPSVTKKDQVFRDAKEGFSFRYPTGWEEMDPQLASTRVLLYARDGTQATCNVGVVGADKSNIGEYDKSYFNSVIAPHIQGSRLVKLERRRVLAGDVMFWEYDYKMTVGDKSVQGRSLTMIALRGGKRYMMVCNMPANTVAKVRPSFDLMSSTFLFSEPKKPSIKVFHDEKGRFSFKYPSDWVVKQPQRAETQALIAWEGTGGNWATCCVTATPTTATDVRTFDKAYFEAHLRPEMTDLQILRIRYARIAGLERAFIECTWTATTATQDLKLRSLATAGIRYGNRYMMVCHSPERSYQSVAVAFELLTSTFLLETPQSKGGADANGDQ